jgi:hypothetical protein
MEQYLKMRKRPVKESLENDFISQAIADKKDNSDESNDFYNHMIKVKWPIEDREVSPSLEKGSHLRKPINLPLREYEWNSLDKHTKSLGVQKSEWIRYAIFKLMHEEQNYFRIKNKR